MEKSDNNDSAFGNPVITRSRTPEPTCLVELWTVTLRRYCLPPRIPLLRMKQHCRRQDVSVGIMDEIGIGLLSPKHENAAFDCGNVASTRFSTNMLRSISNTA